MNQYVCYLWSDHLTASADRGFFLGTIGQQEVQWKLQGNNRGRLLDQRSSGGRPVGDDAGRSSSQLGQSAAVLIAVVDLGYCRPRTVSVSRCRILPRRRLLRPRLRREQLEEFRGS